MKKALLFLSLILLAVCVLSSCQKECTHENSEWVTETEATCSSDGKTNLVCFDCNEVLNWKTISVIDHTYGEWEYDESSYPTCTEDGREVRFCTLCNDSEFRRCKALGHDEEVIEGYPATCDNWGYTDGVKCSRCNVVLVSGERIPYKEHTKGEVQTIAPTELSLGLNYIDCTVCGERLFEEEIPYVGDIGLEYELYVVDSNEGEVKLCSIIGIGSFEGSELIIPDYIMSYKVTEIADRAFENCANLTSVVLPSALAWIGCDAFDGCTSLASITFKDRLPNDWYELNIPPTSTVIWENVTHLNSNTSNSSITSITFKGNIPEMRYSKAFPNLSTVIIEDGVTNIDETAFANCTSLTSISIPDSVTTIGGGAFKGCTSLTSITVPDLVTIIGDSLFKGCTALTSVTIGNSVTTIGEGAFEGCTSLASIIISDSVTTIGDSAFKGCTTLTSVTIGNSVTTIGDGSFESCTLLTSIIISDSVTTIGDSAFKGCTALTSVTIGNSVTTIGSSAFSDCDSLQYNRYDYINYLGNDENPYYALIGHQYVQYSQIINGNTIVIAADAMWEKVQRIIFEGNIPEYSYGSLKNLIEIVLEDGVTSIPECAFEGCTSLTSVTIGNSVTSFAPHAFKDCTSLTRVYLNSVTTILSITFENCYSLTDIYFIGTSEEWAKKYIKWSGSDPLSGTKIHYEYVPTT